MTIFQKMFAGENFASIYSRTAERITGVGAVRMMRFAGLHDEQRDVRVLDLATGTGIIPSVLLQDKKSAAKDLFSPRAHVTATDLSPVMVDFCKNRAGEESWPEGKFELHVGNALETGFEDESFDYVLCSFGIQSMPEHDKAFKEWSRVAKRGSKVVVNGWAKIFWLDIMDEAQKRSDGLLKIPEQVFGFAKTGQADYLSDLAQKAGLNDIQTKVEEWNIDWESADQFFESIAVMLPSIAGIQLDETEKVAKVGELVRSVVHDQYGTGPFVLPGIATSVVGTK